MSDEKTLFIQAGQEGPGPIYIRVSPEFAQKAMGDPDRGGSFEMQGAIRPGHGLLKTAEPTDGGSVQFGDPTGGTPLRVANDEGARDIRVNPEFSQKAMGDPTNGGPLEFAEPTDGGPIQFSDPTSVPPIRVSHNEGWGRISRDDNYAVKPVFYPGG